MGVVEASGATLATEAPVECINFSLNFGYGCTQGVSEDRSTVLALNSVNGYTKHPDLFPVVQNF